MPQQKRLWTCSECGLVYANRTRPVECVECGMRVRFDAVEIPA